MPFGSGPASVYSCPCQGVDGTHVVYVAFLNYYTQTQYAHERWLHDYLCISTNYATVLWQGSPFYHTQIFFWDNAAQCALTYSVDNTQKRVFRVPMKQFAKTGWTFVRIEVTRAQEIAIERFLMAQVDKPFNRGAFSIFCTGHTDRSDESWFCSELATSALQAGNLLRDVDAATMTPAELYEVLVANAARINAVVGVDHPVRAHARWQAIRARVGTVRAPQPMRRQ